MPMKRIEFDNNESYDTDGPVQNLGPGSAYANLRGYHIADGLVIMTFTNNATLKIPERRLLRILEV